VSDGAAAGSGHGRAAPRDAAELYESEVQAGRGAELKEGLASALAAGNIGGVVSAAAAAAAAGLSGVTGLVGEVSSSKTTAGGSGEVVQILDGLILRSQLLVLLQRRHFCDSLGRPIGREYCEKKEIELEVRFYNQAMACSCIGKTECSVSLPAYEILAIRFYVYSAGAGSDACLSRFW
jgi:hypothetical protein